MAASLASLCSAAAATRPSRRRAPRAAAESASSAAGPHAAGAEAARLDGQRQHAAERRKLASQQVAREDADLGPHQHAVYERGERHRLALLELGGEIGAAGLKEYAEAQQLGFRRLACGGTAFGDWAPGAAAASLIGDFNGWDVAANPCERDEFGNWRCVVPSPGVPHGSRVRVAFESPAGERFDRLPTHVVACATAAAGEGDDAEEYLDALHWDPPPEERHEWRHARPPKAAAPRVYEAHVGMSSEEPEVASYRHFADEVLPRVARLGYNTVQLMGVQEHSLYSSFGYQVTSFFAVAHRSGTPEDLKYLIDTAHGLGLRVLLDLVHSHASQNTKDGLNMHDGTDHCHFHSGERGFHRLWTTRMFDYGRDEVRRFLLSNVAWWLEEYRFDGFRFDGVTAMLYHHRGVHWDFLGGTSEYFNPEYVDEDAVLYLKLANDLTKALVPSATTICEDVSAFPGSTRPTRAGGLGFDFRLGMGPADQWFGAVERCGFENELCAGELVGMLMNRRGTDRTLSYVESHDQAMVGGMSFAQALMGEDIWHNMAAGTAETPGVHRGVALHKLARLLTLVCGGDGWLSFMGNEFGHPAWIDFPREGNGQSFEHARRRWSLADADPESRHAALERFDAALMALDEEHMLLSAAHVECTHCNEGAKVVSIERGDLVCVFNLSRYHSHVDYRLGMPMAGQWQRVLDSDLADFAGHSRLMDGGDTVLAHSLPPGELCDRRHAAASLYLPALTASVFKMKPGAGYDPMETYSSELGGAGDYGEEEVWW